MHYIYKKEDMDLKESGVVYERVWMEGKEEGNDVITP